MDCCKVGVVTEKRNLTVTAGNDIHEYLVARWVGKEDYPEMGVRKLADWFNRKLLRAEYTRHDRTVTDVRITSEYKALKGDDDVKQGEVIDDLKSDGIDGKLLIDDFVSRSTMRRHLTNCLGASKTSDNGDSESNWEVDQINHSQRHFERKIDEAVTSLANKGRLPGGTEANIETPIFLSCPKCATKVRLTTALERQFICEDHLDSSTLTDSETVVR